MAIGRMHGRHGSTARGHVSASMLLAKRPQAVGLRLSEAPTGQLHSITWRVQRQVNMHHLERRTGWQRLATLQASRQGHAR